MCSLNKCEITVLKHSARNIFANSFAQNYLIKKKKNAWTNGIYFQCIILKISSPKFCMFLLNAFLQQLSFFLLEVTAVRRPCRFNKTVRK